MTQVSMKLDYLSITGKVKPNEGDENEDYFIARINLCRRLLHGLGVKSPTLQTVQPAKYYAMSVNDLGSNIRVNLGENLSSQGWQIILSGQALGGFDTHGILPAFMDIWRGKITRADFAVDFIWSGCKVEHLAEDYRVEHGLEGVKSFSFISSKSGSTVYVGSRTSEKMLRVYDKGGEQGVPIDWLRVEFETKGGNAHRLFEVFLHNHRQVAAEMRDFLNTPDTMVSSLLNLVAHGQLVEATRQPRVVPDRVKWFNGQVMQSYIKLCQDDPEAARDIWEKFHETWYAHEIWRMWNESVDKVANSLIQ